MKVAGLYRAPTRIVTVSISGREPSRPNQTASRLELVAACIRHLGDRAQWGPYQALLLPAGTFRTGGGQLRPSSAELVPPRDRALTDALSSLAARLDRKSAGCLLVAGIDAVADGRWRGEMLVAAFGSSGPVAAARMIYPVKGDRTMVHETDYDSQERFVTLANGQRAVLCVCYDAFALAELALAQPGRRGNIGYVADVAGRRRKVSLPEGERLMTRFGRQLTSQAPDLALVAIHRFERPGRELLWQRHGLATASAALGGGLVVGAAHYTAALPSRIEQSPLAAFGAPASHLQLGGRRPALEHAPLDGFEVALPWDPHHRALVRLYEAG